MLALTMQTVSYLPALRAHICGNCASRQVYMLPEIGGGYVCPTCAARECSFCASCGAAAFDVSELNFYPTATNRAKFLCDDCLPPDAVFCDHCGEYFPSGSLTEARDACGNIISVCSGCLEADFSACACCEEYYPSENLTTVADGSLVCEDCLADQYFYCDYCNEYHGESAACSAHNSDDESIYVCKSCRDQNFTRCDDCGEYFLDDDMARTDCGDYVCPECRESNYAYCDRCGDLCLADNIEFVEDADEFLCTLCASEYEETHGCGELLHEYSYKPKNTFFRTDADAPGASLYFGVELELSHSNMDVCRENFNACHAILNPDEEEENIYTKKDSTLNNGFEIVSHPRTLSSWHDFAPTLEEYFNRAADFTTGRRDGLHVHISRRGMTDAHMLRFSAFVNAVQDELMPIARRRSEWGSYADRPRTAGDCKRIRRCTDHYSAVNWCPYATVELRIFCATIDLREFMAAVEFAHAAYQFTKYCTTMQILRGDPWALFLSFLAGYPQKYGSLIGLLRDAYSNPEAPKPEFFAALGKEKRRAA